MFLLAHYQTIPIVYFNKNFLDEEKVHDDDDDNHNCTCNKISKLMIYLVAFMVKLIPPPDVRLIN